MLTKEGLRLKSKDELKALKKMKNADFGLCFEPIKDNVQDEIDLIKDIRSGVIELEP